MTTPGVLTQEQVERECQWLVEEHCGSAARKWLATDAALRQALAQQAQEVERLTEAYTIAYQGKEDLRRQLAAMTTEREAACGELLVSLDDAPIGSLAGKLVTANRVLRSQLAASQARCRELEDKLQSCYDSFKPNGATYC